MLHQTIAQVLLYYYLSFQQLHDSKHPFSQSSCHPNYDIE